MKRERREDATLVARSDEGHAVLFYFLLVMRQSLVDGELCLQYLFTSLARNSVWRQRLFLLSLSLSLSLAYVASTKRRYSTVYSTVHDSSAVLIKCASEERAPSVQRTAYSAQPWPASPASPAFLRSPISCIVLHRRWLGQELRAAAYGHRPQGGRVERTRASSPTRSAMNTVHTLFWPELSTWEMRRSPSIRLKVGIHVACCPPKAQ